MVSFQVNEIGAIAWENGEVRIILDKAYSSALTGLDGFSHVQVLWWFSQCDNPPSRSTLSHKKPYKHSPAVLGTFATRAPMRPNPIGLDCVEITYIDQENAVIGLGYIDAYDGSPVLDIKPYTPSLDRVEDPAVPHWCGHWPKCYEESGHFDWEREMNY